MPVIAVDLGGTNVKMGVVDNGLVVNSYSFESHSERGLMPILRQIEEKAEEWAMGMKLDAVGISYPGLVDQNRKKIISHCSKFSDAIDFDFTEWSKKKFGVPVILENDANAAAVGENVYGAGSGSDNMVLMILGTGIGSAAIMNGELVRGKHYQAGCFMGHIPVKVDGRKCLSCGGQGCAEAQASTWALKQIVKDYEDINSLLVQEKNIDFRALRKYVNSGDELAERVFTECCRYWANCFTALIYAYDPEVAVLSGGIINWGPDLANNIFGMAKNQLYKTFSNISFRVSKNPNESVLLGLWALYEKSLRIR